RACAIGVGPPGGCSDLIVIGQASTPDVDSPRRPLDSSLQSPRFGVTHPVCSCPGSALDPVYGSGFHLTRRKSMRGLSWIVVTLGIASLPAAAQEAGPTSANPAKAAATPAGNAATGHGQPNTELAVQRGLKRVPPAHQAEARAEIIDYLVDNVLLDQYLQQLRIEITPKEIDNRVEEIRAEMKRGGQTFENVLQELMLTEAELRSQLAAELRWEKFIDAQANDKVLRELFDKNPELFDGSMVHARHILLH